MTLLGSLSLRAQSDFVGAGANASGPGGTVTYSLGQIGLQSNENLQEGLHQIYRYKIQVRAFLQGYYEGQHQMSAVLNQQGVPLSNLQLCDTVDLIFHENIPPYQAVKMFRQPIQRNGYVEFFTSFKPHVAMYLSIRHRNSVEVWSASAMTYEFLKEYDFSSAIQSAYGSNLAEIDSGLFGLFSGDINQDGVVDGLDYNLWEEDSNLFASGYVSTDLNGDGIVDGMDFLFCEMNSNQFIGTIQP